MWKDRTLCWGEPMHSLQPSFGGIKVAPGQMSNKCCHQGQAKPVLAQGKSFNLDFVLNIDSRNAWFHWNLIVTPLYMQGNGRPERFSNLLAVPLSGQWGNWESHPILSSFLNHIKIITNLSRGKDFLLWFPRQQGEEPLDVAFVYLDTGALGLPLAMWSGQQRVSLADAAFSTMQCTQLPSHTGPSSF